MYDNAFMVNIHLAVLWSWPPIIDVFYHYLIKEWKLRVFLPLYQVFTVSEGDESCLNNLFV